MHNLQKNTSKQNHWLLFPFMLTLILVLSACGNSNTTVENTGGTSNTSNTTAATQAPTETSQEAESAETPAVKTVSTVKGDVEIPVHPKRIVAEEYLGSLIALDTIPIGAPGLTLENMYYKEALTGVTDTGAYGKMSPEKIIALNPDLIISGQAESYETLSKIAPTIIVPYGDLKMLMQN